MQILFTTEVWILLIQVIFETNTASLWGFPLVNLVWRIDFYCNGDENTVKFCDNASKLYIFFC